MSRRSTIRTHPLINDITGDLAQAQHHDGLTPHTAHANFPRSIRKPVVPPKNSDILVADTSRITEHDPNDPDNSRLSDDAQLGVSFLDERRISKRGPRDADGPVHLTISPKHRVPFLDNPHVMKRSPDEETEDQDNGQADDQGNGQDDQDSTPSEHYVNPERYNNVILSVFEDAPRHHHRGL